MKAAVMIALAVVLGTAMAAAPSELTSEQSEWLFDAWVKQHNKQYTPEEAVHRYGIWLKNYAFITETNAKKLSYKVGLNEFADLSADEWKAKMTTQRPNAPKPQPNMRVSSHKAKPQAPPTKWDWRDHGAVNPVQNEGQCGSCWAFTAGDAISGLWAIKTTMLFPVSVQEIIDCSSSQGNQGCNGGWPAAAFQWVIANGGICDWQEYQYTAETGTCASQNCTNVATIKSVVSLNAGDEASIMPALYVQPLSGAVDASGQAFQFYSSGVLDDPSCTTDIDHGMTFVGWGTDATAKADYWTLRNMWGSSWGENGYIRVVRNKNMCGLAEAVAYPTL